MEQMVVKRNGTVAPYDSNRVRIAVKKSVEATLENGAEEIIDSVVDEVDMWIKLYEGNELIPAVEQIQDEVEKSLMKQGMFETAKAYILYRSEHNRLRLEHQARMVLAAGRGEISVVKRNGEREPFKLEKVSATLARVATGTGLKDADSIIIKEWLKLTYDQMPSSQILDSLILCTTSFIEREPAFDAIAAALFREKIYKEVIGTSVSAQTLDTAYRNAFIETINSCVGVGLLDARMKDFDGAVLAAHLDLKRDALLEYMGMQTLYERYFLKTPQGKRLETPQSFWMRVAMGLALHEKDKTEKALQFYAIISSLRFIPSTPTLFHAGTHHPQLSSCYVTTIGDDLSDIFKCLGDNAQYSKWSGGLGNDWTSVRATGARIASTGVESQGVIPFLKIANDVTMAINRSGKRRGATCAYLETWHMDIEDFLDLRRNTGDERRRTHDMNTSHWIPDLFMKRVEQNAPWTLFSPEEVPDLHEMYGKAFEDRYCFYERSAAAGEIKKFRTMEARALWRKMITRLFETGHPWITFKDPCNVRSPQDHVGVIHSSNLCTEITLNTSAHETAVCNLGSVNIAAHLDSDRINDPRIKETIEIALRMLDNVVDLNFYPTQESRTANMLHRPVGLGIMGLQDALFKLRIPFDSNKALAFNNTLMEMVAYYAIGASSDLAAERGAYQTFKGSKWQRGILPPDTIALLEKERGKSIQVHGLLSKDWEALRKKVVSQGMRNSNCMAIAPTATIATIAGCYPSIEPAYKNLYVKANISGEFAIVNKYLVADLKHLGIWNDDIRNQIKFYDGSIEAIESIPKEIRALYREAFEVDPDMLLKCAAVRGSYIDQSQSINLFVRGTKGKLLDEIYRKAWEYGLKTTYYLRTLAATQVEKATLDATFGFTQMRRDNTGLEAMAAAGIKACSILDPGCESCQ